MNACPNTAEITEVAQANAVQTNTDTRPSLGIAQVQKPRPKGVVLVCCQIFTDLDG